MENTQCDPLRNYKQLAEEFERLVDSELRMTEIPERWNMGRRAGLTRAKEILQKAIVHLQEQSGKGFGSRQRRSF